VDSFTFRSVENFEFSASCEAAPLEKIPFNPTKFKTYGAASQTSVTGATDSGHHLMM
jgi:hypothetical protein